jgi:hypothetical protein
VLFVRAAVLRPADLVKRLVRVGLLFAALAAGVVAALNTLSVSRQCSGSFSRGFGAAFDVRHCDVTLRFASGGPRLTFRLP